MTESYIEFTEHPHNPKRKTKIWEVRNKENGILLGHVAWYAPWRKYCFGAQPECIFEEICLADIARFVKSQTLSHKLAGEATWQKMRQLKLPT